MIANREKRTMASLAKRIPVVEIDVGNTERIKINPVGVSLGMFY